MTPVKDVDHSVTSAGCAEDNNNKERERERERSCGSVLVGRIRLYKEGFGSRGLSSRRGISLREFTVLTTLEKRMTESFRFILRQISSLQLSRGHNNKVRHACTIMFSCASSSLFNFAT